MVTFSGALRQFRSIVLFSQLELGWKTVWVWCFIIQKQSVGYINHPVGNLSDVFGWNMKNDYKLRDMLLSALTQPPRHLIFMNAINRKIMSHMTLDHSDWDRYVQGPVRLKHIKQTPMAFFILYLFVTWWGMSMTWQQVKSLLLTSVFLFGVRMCVGY